MQVAPSSSCITAQGFRTVSAGAFVEGKHTFSHCNAPALVGMLHSSLGCEACIWATACQVPSLLLLPAGMLPQPLQQQLQAAAQSCPEQHWL
jgi:hypothetical protein